MINLHAHTIRCGHASGEDRDYIEEIRRIVDSYGDDEEKQRLCDA